MPQEYLENFLRAFCIVLCVFSLANIVYLLAGATIPFKFFAGNSSLLIAANCVAPVAVGMLTIGSYEAYDRFLIRRNRQRNRRMALVPMLPDQEVQDQEGQEGQDQEELFDENDVIPLQRFNKIKTQI